ncbi:MAG: ATP-binding protein [Mycoplasmataceae bacterium]|jgi:primosomal protein DnaI|nr:ATP-binding protein [Mycoplasmataceae bacterium]
MDNKHANILKNLRIKTTIDDAELQQYRHHPSIIDLNLTDKEFKQYFGVITRMVKEQSTAPQENPNNEVLFYTKLIRDQRGKLKVISVPTEKIYDLMLIRLHYLIRDFPDRQLNILLNAASIGKVVDVSKKKLLLYYINDVLGNISKASGAYVYGNVGIGKTYTAIGLANELAKREFNVAFVNCADIAYKLKRGFDKDNDVNDELVNKMKEADALFLDDIGAEDEKVWFYNNYLMIILNYRMDRKKLTFFTSNLSIDAFSQRLSNLMHKSFNADRLIERIRALTKNQQFEITGNNQRY